MASNEVRGWWSKLYHTALSEVSVQLLVVQPPCQIDILDFQPFLPAIYTYLDLCISAEEREGASEDAGKDIVYMCFVCPRTLSTKDGLKDHLTHHKWDTWQFFCPYCGYGHDSGKRITHHCKQVHRGNR